MKTFKTPFIHSFLTLCVLFLVACGGSEKETQKTSTEAETAAPEQKLNINTASGDEFRTIPKVGDRMVHEFEEYRPYVSIQQFRKEIGKYVDENQVAAYEKYIFVPIHRNNSDSETLLQIPGLDAEEAQKLVDGRPFDSNQAFLDALSSFVSQEEAVTAENYLKAE